MSREDLSAEKFLLSMGITPVGLEWTLKPANPPGAVWSLSSAHAVVRMREMALYFAEQEENPRIEALARRRKLLEAKIEQCRRIQ